MHPQGLLGVLVLLAAAYACSDNRRRINWRIVFIGVPLQIAITWIMLKYPPVVAVFDWLARGMTRIVDCGDAGTRFLFGNVADPGAGPWGFVFAVRVLPVIVFFASLMSVLYYLGLMQRLVAGIAWALRRTLGLTGAEALSAAANIFLGQTEAPLTVKPYIAGMTRSQLMCIMVGGFATIAGSVLAAYISMLGSAYAQAMGHSGEGAVLFARHLMAASVLSTPASIVMAKIMVPEVEHPRPETVSALLAEETDAVNVVDAAAAGATDGLKLALNVAAMLVAFVALLALINWPLTAFSEWEPIAQWRTAHGLPTFSLQHILGWVFTPIAWCMGVEGKDCNPFGGLLGTQIIATEFVAYTDLAAYIKANTISIRSAAIATYALCGFANIASIGIQIGGLSAMAPSRRSDLARLAPRAMLAGALACWMTGSIAGLFI